MVVYLDNGVLFSDKKKWAIKSQKTWRRKNAYCWVKGVSLEKATTVCLHYKNSGKEQYYRDREKMGAKHLGEGMNRYNTGSFRAVKPLYMILWWQIWHYTFAKPIEPIDRVNLK